MGYLYFRACMNVILGHHNIPEQYNSTIDRARDCGVHIRILRILVIRRQMTTSLGLKLGVRACLLRALKSPIRYKASRESLGLLEGYMHNKGHRLSDTQSSTYASAISK